jgi:hypothetical protein
MSIHRTSESERPIRGSPMKLLKKDLISPEWGRRRVLFSRGSISEFAGCPALNFCFEATHLQRTEIGSIPLLTSIHGLVAWTKHTRITFLAFYGRFHRTVFLDSLPGQSSWTVFIDAQHFSCLTLFGLLSVLLFRFFFGFFFSIAPCIEF